MTTHPESHDLVEALRALCHPDAEVFSDSERVYRFIVASRALLAALASEAASQVPADDEREWAEAAAWVHEKAFAAAPDQERPADGK